MTLMDFLLLGGSLAGVLALALVAWLLGLGGASIADEAQARRAAEEAHIGFVAAAAFVSADGRAALVRGVDGRFVLLKVHGANVAARRLETPLRVTPTEKGVTIATSERMFGDVRLALPAENRDSLIADVARPVAPAP